MRHKSDVIVGESWVAKDILFLLQSSNETEVIGTHFLHNTGLKFESQDVGLNLIWVDDASINRIKLLREPSCVEVILSQFLLPVHK